MEIDVQGLMLDLIQFASCNFDGPNVRKALEWRRNYWEACMMTSYRPGVTLRDLSQGIFNADTLYILPAPGREKELERLANQWKAKSVKWMEREDAALFLGQHGTDKKVLEVWWD